jgi:hypothetical protein
MGTARAIKAQWQRSSSAKAGVKIGLAYGASLPDPNSLLRGVGKIHRHIEVRTQAQLRQAGVEQLLAAALSLWRMRATGAKVNKLGIRPPVA